MAVKTKEQISNNMSRVKNKDTQIEWLLRRELWSRGLRYRKNVSAVYGHPDIAFLRKKIAVFCDSEFWHGFEFEKRKTDFKSNQGFWLDKIERNIARDKLVNETLKEQGWTVIRFWGKDIKKKPIECGDIVEKAVRNSENI